MCCTIQPLRQTSFSLKYIGTQAHLAREAIDDSFSKCHIKTISTTSPLFVLFQMNVSDIIDRKCVLEAKIASYEAFLTTNKALYEGLHGRITELQMEISAGDKTLSTMVGKYIMISLRIILSAK